MDLFIGCALSCKRYVEATCFLGRADATGISFPPFPTSSAFSLVYPPLYLNDFGRDNFQLLTVDFTDYEVSSMATLLRRGNSSERHAKNGSRKTGIRMKQPRPTIWVGEYGYESIQLLLTSFHLYRSRVSIQRNCELRVSQGHGLDRDSLSLT